MQKIIFICLLGLFGVISFQYNYGRGGRYDNKIVQLEIVRQSQINAILNNRNSLELMRIEGLKGSSDFLEARARYELNLIKPNEKLVILPGNYLMRVNGTTK